MNKQDLAAIKKEMKLENTMFSIKEIYSVYLKKDNQSVIHSVLEYFDSFDSEKQELYMKNFKKVLSGALDTKLFELEFALEKYDDNAQKILYSAINGDKDTFVAEADKIVLRIAENYKYETDAVITFIKAEYWKGASKRRNADADESIDDNVFAFEFMMCSVNKIDMPKKALHYDFFEKEFKINSALDAIINVNSPLDGFMFPAFNNNAADVNRIMYYTGNQKAINMSFVEEILNCEFKKTAQEEKDEFVGVLKSLVGEKVAPETLQTIYENISKKLEDEEESEAASISLNEIKDVLVESGIEDLESLEKAYEEVAVDTIQDFKVQNIVPDMKSKSIKINTEDVSLSIAPKELKNIRKVKDRNGNTCLLIELSDDVIIDGFEIPTGEI